jgi:hypothetical protein
MKTVHVARSPLEAHLVAHILRDAGLAVTVTGETLQGALGELPVDLSTMPAVSVVRDEDVDRALSILAEHKRAVSRHEDTDGTAT